MMARPAAASVSAFQGSLRACLLALCAACACGDHAGDVARGDQARGSANVGGQVISTVHGFAISVAEVEALARESGMAPAQALERLQAERLLMAEAEQRGFEFDPEVRGVARQAAVQALLDQLADAEQVSDADVKAAYAKAQARFVRPEQRATVHVLARFEQEPTPAAEAAAKAYIAQLLQQLAATDDPQAFVTELHGKRMPEFVVTGEVLPPIARRSAIAQEYLEATFALAQPGVVPEPVRTSFGWHAIRVTQIAPAETTPFETAALELRPELERALRQKLVDAWLERARRKQGAQQTKDASKAIAGLPP